MNAEPCVYCYQYQVFYDDHYYPYCSEACQDAAWWNDP